MSLKDHIKTIINFTSDEEFNIIFKIISLEKRRREAKKKLNNIITHEYAKCELQECTIFIDDYLDKL